MNAVNIKVAGFVVQINTEYPPSPRLYADFRTEDSADFQVTLSDDDIDFDYYASHGKLPIKTPCILRKVADALLDYNVILCHGVVIAVNNQAYLFVGPSKTGKSTHADLWRDLCPDAYVINGDKPFLRFLPESLYPLACGSPWAGKENMYTNTMVPLRSIILMERAEANHIERISFGQAFPFLLPQVYRPEDEEKMRKTLRLMRRLSPAVSFWHFECNNFKDDCFQVAYSALMGGEML